ncbi:hypothetical protein HYX14_04800 [Candidatus Woesearchaeota archaeon]|nr:hypothetical protein [Candidatus Woesearchaeota archaeon]
MLEEATQKEWEERIRASLGKDYQSYNDCKVLKTWRSRHAEFAKIQLANAEEKRGKSHIFVAKHYVPIEGYDEPAHVKYHTPEFLWTREHRNLKQIRNLVMQGCDSNPRFVKKLIPPLVGASRRYHTVVEEFLNGENKKKELLGCHQDPKIFNASFLDGVKVVARFNGVINAHKSKFERNALYKTDALVFNQVDQSLFKENLVRAVYHFNSNCKTAVGEYKFSPTEDFIKQRLAIPLEERLSELFGMADKLHHVRKLQHRDCNGLNQIGQTMLDLEDFGYSSWADDISSYCTVVGLGTNAVMRSADFPAFLLTYLALEQAYESKDETAVEQLQKASNGEFKKYVAQHMSEGKYSLFLISFFDKAIDKNLQLIASIPRGQTSPPLYDSKTIFEELFTTIYDLQNDLDRCDSYLCETQKTAAARELLYGKGKLLHDLGIVTIPDSLLNGIRSRGTIAGRLQHESPFPAQ